MQEPRGLMIACLILGFLLPPGTTGASFQPNTNAKYAETSASFGTTTGSTPAISLAAVETAPAPAPVPVPEPVRMLCSAQGCVQNACQQGLPSDRTMRICHAQTSGADFSYTIKTIDCRYADLNPQGETLDADGSRISNLCPGTHNLDCRCKPILLSHSQPTAVPSVSTPPADVVVATPTPVDVDTDTDCAHGGWKCPTVTTTDGATIGVSHRESTVISVAVVDPKTEKILVPSVCRTTDCSIRICVALLSFDGGDDENQTLEVRFDPEPECGLGRRGLGQPDDVCGNQPPEDNAGCNASRYTAPPINGPNGWKRVLHPLSDEADPALRFADSKNIMQICRTTTLAAMLRDCSHSAILTKSSVQFTVIAAVRTPLPASLLNSSRTLCPRCKDGPCCDVASHVTRQAVVVPVSNLEASALSVPQPMTSLNMLSTVLDIVIDSNVSVCTTFATIVNAPAALLDGPEITVGASRSGHPAPWTWNFDVSSLGACTEGGIGRTCQMWMLCSPIEARTHAACVDVNLVFAASADTESLHQAPIYAQEMVHICLPAPERPANSNATNSSGELERLVPISIQVLPSVVMRTFVGLSCTAPYDGITPVLAGTPMCFEACVDNYPLGWPGLSMTLAYASIDIHPAAPGGMPVTKSPDVVTSILVTDAISAAEKNVKRIVVNRGFQDARDHLWLPPPDMENYTPGTAAWMAAQQDAAERLLTTQTVGRHCLRHNQIAHIGDGPWTTVNVNYILNRAPTAQREPTPAVDTVTTTTIGVNATDNITIPGRSLLSTDDDNNSHHHRRSGRDRDRDNDRFDEPIFGSSSATFATICPVGTLGRRMPCGDGFRVDDTDTHCRDGTLVPLACDPSGWRGDDRGSSVAVVILIVFAVLLLCSFGYCIWCTGQDAWMGTPKSMHKTEKTAEEGRTGK